MAGGQRKDLKFKRWRTVDRRRSAAWQALTHRCRRRRLIVFTFWLPLPSYGGHLAALASLEELAFVKNLCVHHSSGCWVGGLGYNTSLGYVWQWSDNRSSWNASVFHGDPSHINCNGASCNTNSSSSCTLITEGQSTLNGEKCDETQGFICMLYQGLINLNTFISENRCHHNQCHQEYFIILVVVSALILCTTMAVVIWLLIYRRSKKRRRSRKSSSSSAAALVPPSWKIFTMEEVISFTKNFSEGNRLHGKAKTGGTFGGTLPDGSRVAVKRLKRSTLQRKKEFYSEVGRVARLHHSNIVAVKGCCYNHGDRYILYEFVANGPLDKWLHHIPRGGRCLNWAMRMRIATTLAQGIAFLHDKVKPHVVHRNICANNVLLDEEFGARLLGVGLSKFVPWEVMQGRTVMAGTHGYLAPEFVYRNELTTKSDVHSFGVLLLEIISGRRPAQAVESLGWQTIFEWATPLVQSHRYLELLDPVIFDIPEVGVVQKVVDLVYSCTQHVPSVRPRMSHVVHQLQQLSLRASTKQPSSRTSTSAASPSASFEIGTSSMRANG
ncbi:C-type lectin receptor-like tyrosine-protein kinase [Apostasia shenzhenica]|uniref:C-type lectin receptor-like tyrosine-protein kinase n=1 Tax=Apostasia shenzhenica TaxID=1088818 RepID=A0A2H9ZWG2_9ASPA|nr:C-type lectin receptor-like tyrosine-protein kinase [Apostasia shenzhenica]